MSGIFRSAITIVLVACAAGCADVAVGDEAAGRHVGHETTDADSVAGTSTADETSVGGVASSLDKTESPDARAVQDAAQQDPLDQDPHPLPWNDKPAEDKDGDGIPDNNFVPGFGDGPKLHAASVTGKIASGAAQ